MHFVISFIDRWIGTTLPKLFLLFLGILLVVLVIAALWDRRVKAIGASIGLFIGLLMAGIALEEGIAGFISSVEPATRIRISAVVFSLILLILTILSVLKTGLKKRYAITWITTGLIVLLTALFPELLKNFPSLLGIRYGVAVAALFIFFLLLMVFHFSITLSELHHNQFLLLQRVSSLEAELGKKTSEIETIQAPTPSHIFSNLKSNIENRLRLLKQKIETRSIRGTSLLAPVIIFLAISSVIITGLSAPQVMVGDEVTHFYMLTAQSHDLSKPNFYSKIPVATGSVETRRYPHSFLWHYLGAIIYRITGSFIAIQCYQSIFLAQLLIIAYLLARSRGGVESRSALLYLVVIASLPLTLIFSVTFYQDVPLTAQVLTAFYFLSKRRWVLASIFISFSIALKETAILFFPAFFALLLLWELKKDRWKKGVVILCCSIMIVLSSTWMLGRMVNKYAGIGFYPQVKLERLLNNINSFVNSNPSRGNKQTDIKNPINQSSLQQKNTPKNVETAPVIIANNPGDLRIKENYLIYGGLLLWMLLIAYIVTYVGSLRKHDFSASINNSSLWLWIVGISYMTLTAFLIRSSPDARFFLPGIPFLILPLVERIVVRWPKPKIIISIFVTLAILQSGYVLAKTYRLRLVSPAIKEAINFLDKNPPSPLRVFMYPEGNYRLFPVFHEWYLGYRLREFWRSNNDKRISMLHEHEVGAIVIKKHLISSVDSKITNLGVYPVEFVEDIKRDMRFKKTFENGEIVIYLVPN